MSIFYYFISNKPLDSSIINRAHAIHYNIDDVTEQVKDARVSRYYYLCDPYSVYVTKDKFNVYETLAYRESQESNLFLWLAEEFSELGNLKFIKIWDDNSKWNNGHFERFLQSCCRYKISYMDFCWSLASNEKGLEIDTAYDIIF